MIEKKEIYKCEKCGNIVEVVHGGKGALVCCGENMVKFEEKTADSSTEKHVPIVEEINEGIRVIVGSTEHPMTEEHFIEWIEVINGDYINRKYLKPGDKPVAEFYVKKQPGLIVRSFCNLHGLWKNENI